MTDAYVGSAYTYNPITAVSPQAAVPLTFSLLSSTVPAGQLSVSTTNTGAGTNTGTGTGLLTWTPTADEAGNTYSVTLEVTDSQGVTAPQSFNIAVHQVVGNSPPVIISKPRTDYNGPGNAGTSSGTVTPPSMALELANGQGTGENVTVTLGGSSNLFQQGDIVAAVGNGVDEVYAPDGTHIATLSSGLDPDAGKPEYGNFNNAGLAFDSKSNLYSTQFTTENGSEGVTLFDSNGNMTNPDFVQGTGGHPESIVFDASGNFYVGQASVAIPNHVAGTDTQILEFNSNGTPRNSFEVPVENRGSDWIDLASDQQTLYYTSEGKYVMTYNTATGAEGVLNKPNDPNDPNDPKRDDVQLPGDAAYALRILPDGSVLVADTQSIERLDSNGKIIGHYGDSSTANWFALNLDPDGTSFWSADTKTGLVEEFNIASEQVERQFFATLQFSGSTDGGDGSGDGAMGGLAIYGQPTAALRNIDVVATDPTVQFTNNTGTVANVGPGGTAVFNLTFVGDISSHTFDLNFVQAATGVVLGSIPVTMDSQYYYPVKAIDPDSDPITYGLTGNTNGATINPDTGMLTWQPTTAGSYNFTVTASDGKGGEDQQPFQVVVTTGANSNNALQFTSTPPQTATVGNELVYQPTVSETSGGAPSTTLLYYYLLNGPSSSLGNMSIDRFTGEVTWTPFKTNDNNPVTAEIEVTDGMGASMTQALGITVSNPVTGGNGVPQISWTPQETNLLVGQKFDEFVTATDSDNDPLTFDLPVHPDGMGIDPSTGELVWTPTGDEVGSQTFMVRVRDDHNSSTYQAYAISVTSPNLPPSITSLPVGPAVVGALWQYQLVAEDPENDPVSFTLGSGAPSWLSLNTTTNVLSGTPPQGSGGQSVSISVTASDGNGGSIQSFQLPIVTAVATGSPNFVTASLPDATVASPYEEQIQATDPNGLPLNYSVTSNPTVSGLSIDPQSGVLTWNGPAITGGGSSSTYSVTITAADAVSSTQATYSLTVNSTSSANLPPQITSTPPQNAVIGTPYVYQAEGFDPNGDAIRWSLDQAPQGMVIDSQNGVVAWTPTSDEIGAQSVVLRLMDFRGAYFTQPFSINVHGGSAEPMFLSVPPEQAQKGVAYTYPVVASDPNGLPLTYSVSSSPTASGLSIDPKTGVLTWPNPDNTQSPYTITITASDGVTSAPQTYSLSVVTVPVNEPPVITSLPSEYGDIGHAYQYQVVASDSDDGLAAQPYALLEGPNVGQTGGMSIDSTTGQITWTSPTQGTFMVSVKVTDAGGAITTQTYPVMVTDAPPQIVQNAILMGTVGAQYNYDVQVTGGTPSLTYSLDTNSQNQGMKIDAQGRIFWTPSTTGSQPVTVTVTDLAGVSDSYPFTIVVSADTTAPTVTVQTSQSPAPINQAMSLQVLANDNAAVQAGSLTLTVTAPDGSHSTVTLDSSGTGTYIFTQVGTYTLTGTATDLSGNVGTGTLSLIAYNPADTSPPTVSITSPAGLNGDAPLVNAPDQGQIIGSITDAYGIQSYQLQAIPADGGAPINIPDAISFSPGPTALGGTLGTFDPTNIPNGTYTIVLTATNVDGLSTTTSIKVEVNGQFKLGNFSMSFTDLSLPLSGIPITVTRSYDSLNAQTQGDFGYGWTFGYAQAKLQTTNLIPSDEQIGSGDYQSFAFGTHVWITLPGGQREEFTFEPTSFDDGNSLESLGGDQLYVPAFIAATPGVTDTLTVSTAYLQSPDGTQLVDFGSGEAYNPANPEFGDQFTLTTKEGIQYAIDANTGKILNVRDRNGDTINFSSGAITDDAPDGSSLGQITINRDPITNDITSIFAPDGSKIIYSYNSGDLTGVTHEDASNNVVTSVTLKYADTSQGYPPHLLTQILDGNNTSLLTVTYDKTTGRVTSLTGANGQAAEIGTSISAPGNQTAETSTDYLKYNTADVYDDNGNIVRTIKQENDPNNPAAATYQITIFEYNPNNDCTAQSLPFESDYNDIYTQQPAGYPAYGNGDPNDPDPSVVPSDWEQVDTYDTQGNLLTGKSATGSAVTNTYGTNGELLTSTDAAGDTTTNTYDENGNLESTTDPNGAVTNYQYNTNDQLIETDEPAGANGDRQYIRNQYTNGYITRVESGYIDGGNYVLQNVTSNAVNDNGNVTGQSFTWTNPTPGDGQPNTVTLSNSATYDAAGRVIGTTDEYQHSTTNHYNAAGQMDYSIDAYNNRTNYFYDASGNLVQTQFPDGTVTDTVYDADNEAIYTDARHVPGTPADGTQTVYDGLGRVIETIRLANLVINVDTSVSPATSSFGTAGTTLSTSSTTFNLDGTVASDTAANGLTTVYGYYPDGQQRTATQKNVPVWDPSTGQNVFMDLTTTTTYDGEGRVLTVTDPKENVTAYEYDADGHVVKTTFNDGTYIADTYDASGNKISERDQNGFTTTYKYDSSGNLIEVDQPAVPNPLDLVNGSPKIDTPVTQYTYDAYGDELSETDPNTHKTSFTYDAFGHELSRSLPDGETESFTYDSFGRELTHVDFKGNTTAFKYDDSASGDGRLEGTYYFAPGANPFSANGSIDTAAAGQSSVYTFDSLGRTKTVTDDSGITTDNYDQEGNLTEQDTPEGDIHYFYNNLNQLTETWTGTGTDPNLATTATQYGYDSLGRLDAVTSLRLNGQSVNLTTTYAYDADGNEAHEALPNGVTTDYTYDTLNRLLTVAEKNAAGVTMFSDSYHLRADGTRDSDAQTQLQPDGTTDSIMTNWTYDADGRLINEDYTNFTLGTHPQQAWTYDLAGNRLSQTKTDNGSTVVTAYSYNGDNQLTAQGPDANGDGIPDPATATTFSYDSNGSQTNDGTHQYFYDLRNKLVKITDESGNIVATYVYDDSGNRVVEAVTSGGTTTTTYYLTDANNPTGYAQPIEAKSSPANGPATSYVLGDRVLAQVDGSGNVTYLMADGHGSTRLLTNASGAVAAVFNYDAFGGAIGFDPAAAGTVFLFGGDAVYDPASGLYLHGDGTRATDGSRFIQMDSMHIEPGDLGNADLYTYAANDPVNANDPTGRDYSLGSLMVSSGIVLTMGTLVGGLAHLANHSVVGGFFSGAAGAAGLIAAYYEGELPETIWIGLRPALFAVGGDLFDKYTGGKDTGWQIAYDAIDAFDWAVFNSQFDWFKPKKADGPIGPLIQTELKEVDFLIADIMLYKTK